MSTSTTKSESIWNSEPIGLQRTKLPPEDYNFNGNQKQTLNERAHCREHLKIEFLICQIGFCMQKKCA